MAKAQVAPVVEDKDDWDKAFDAAAIEGAEKAHAPVKDEPKTPEEVKTEEAAKVAADAKAVEDAKSQETQDKVAADEAAKVAAKVEANKGKMPEQIAAEDAATKAAEEKAALDAKAAKEADARAAAEAKVRSDAEAKVAAEAQAKADADAKAAAAAERKAKAEALSKPYEPTAEETAALAVLKKEWPEQHAAIEARLKSSAHDVQRQVHAAVQEALKQVGAVVTPLAASVAANDAERHETAIRAAHPDADEVVPLVGEWIKKQPAYLQAAYQKVYDDGSTKEVNDLFTRFKTETGYKVKPAAVVVPPKPGPTAEEIAAGAPVGTRRSTPNPKGAPDKDNYDAAFDEAAAVK
jgi:hypothetical protein